MTAPLAEILVDLGALRRNVRTLVAAVAPAAVMVVVKADAYGHGMVECARAARAAGASWLGVATLGEALTLRAAGDTGPMLSWLDLPGVTPYDEGIAAGVDLTAGSRAELADLAAAARAIRRPARVQLKVDTGLSRGGCPQAEWPGLVAAARAAESAGEMEITGVWSHLAAADEPDHPANRIQQEAFAAALGVVERAGLRPQVRHLANSAGALLHPDSRFDVVRCGITAYGLDPAPGHTPDLGLTPVMTVRTGLVLSKPLAVGDGVSYGHTWIADHPTSVGLVPMGYGDGIPRHAGNRAEVWVAGRRRPVRGRVCMDQFVIDLGGELLAPGTPVVVFGPGHDGEPTAQDWAEATGTISYEIVTRVGGRAVRRYLNRAED